MNISASVINTHTHKQRTTQESPIKLQWLEKISQRKWAYSETMKSPGYLRKFVSIPLLNKLLK